MTVLATCVLAAGAAQGQVETGNVLDANPRIGSGGINTATGAGSGINSQLYITGQVTGLGRFRGRVPYRAANQLGLSLPSASLEDFQRRSVGLADVLSGRSQQTSIYYGRTSTILSLPELAAGLALPGSSAPRRSAARADLRHRLLADATTDYRPGTRQTRQGPPVVSPPDLGGTGQTPSPLSLGVPDIQVSLESRVGREVLFRVPRARDRVRLARELRGMDIEGTSEQFRVKAEVDQTIKAGVEARVPNELETEREARPSAPPQGEPARPTEGDASSGAAQAETLPPPNEDVYVDVLRRLQRRKAEKGEAKAGADGPPGTGRTAQPGENPLVEESPQTGAILVHGLAGSGKDMFNRHMAQAEERLKAGRYYDAAGRYELAAWSDSENPLARVGQGLALFAAGEPVSASLQFRRALEIFPPLMEARIDLLEMLPDEVFERRMGLVLRRLDRYASADLAFLAAVLYHNVGRTEEARKLAKRITEIRSANEVHLAYAQYVLTGSRPGTAGDGSRNGGTPE
jgi:hypothetical protein